MRTAVYNRYWPTGGGAEKYGGAIAQILSADGPLDILTHEPVDLDWLADRLRLDLSRVDVRTIDDAAGSVTTASEDYDLLVNVSYMSVERAASRGSLYVVHFPTPLDGHLSPLERRVSAALTKRRDSPLSFEWGDGFHAREGGARGVTWTSGRGTIRVTTSPGVPTHVEFTFGHLRPQALGPTSVTIEVDGRPAASAVVGTATGRVSAHRGVTASVEVCSPARGVPVEVAVVSDTFVPAEVLGTDDRRHLGVPLRGLHVGNSLLARASRWFPVLGSAPSTIDWLDTYDVVAANSEFTRGWIDRFWERESEVLYPPVTMHAPGAEENVILHVGRFFPADKGHSKKQLELVEAFRALCDRGTTGWTLHLVGGCSEAGRDYLDLVRARAVGYPVELHVNAPGSELESLYGRASIYWHASGFGENPARHPDRLEHFGISTVEAMSAGAVPVVIGLAGQLETVRHGIDGYHFQTLGGLCEITESLIRDEPLRRQMSASAARRARQFSVDAFGQQLHALVDRVVTGGRERVGR